MLKWMKMGMSMTQRIVMSCTWISMVKIVKSMYKAAIKADLLCYEALECLIENHMLSSEEETSLLSSLHFGPEDGWLSSFYSCLIKKYDKEYVVEAKFKELEQESCNSKPCDHRSLKSNYDLLACKVECYQQCGEYQKCFELTSTLLEKDLFHVKSTLVHLAAAMELDYSNELCLMPCNLVKDYPQKALSWFVVGCYYYCIKKYDQSLRYFRYSKSIMSLLGLDYVHFLGPQAKQVEKLVKHFMGMDLDFARFDAYINEHP